MASSRCIEEETGSYSGRIRHPHNGYYAGDFFSQASWAGSQLPVSYPGRRDMSRAELAQYGARALAAAIPDQAGNRRQPAASALRGL